MKAGHAIVLCNCPDTASAERIARELVDSRLAAAVNILTGARSVYRWRGELQQSSEVVLLIKTTAAHYARVEERVRALHPYELPDIVALSVSDGNLKYLEWIETETIGA